MIKIIKIINKFKKNRKIVYFIVIFFSSSMIGVGQNTQTIRGRVIDKNTLNSIYYAQIWININNNIVGTMADSVGNFRIEKVPVGRHEVYANALGYEVFVVSNVLVYSGRETVLEISMIEKVMSMEEVTIRRKVDKDMALNRMATASVRMFSTEEANRYAGAWGDPARMAANFAGVSASNDSRNEIIVRGNSPLGLLWRLDGFDIPNPNHFSVTGSSGGAISMINNNQLTNSDFYTGAFPAEFGNAISGVFDLKLRNGNSNKQEFLASIGFNGAEFGAEGYFKKTSDASYLLNARYSFLESLYYLGMDFGTNGAVPKYRDLTTKVNIPVRNGNLSFITLTGLNKIEAEDDMNNEQKWKEGDLGEYFKERDYQIFFGTNYTRRFNEKTRIENRLSYQYHETSRRRETITYKKTNRWEDYSRTIDEGRIDLSSALYRRFNSRNFLETGLGVNNYITKMSGHRINNENVIEPLHNVEKSSLLIKLYGQLQHRFNDKISLTPGFYSQYYFLTNNYSIEPRIGMQWKNSSSGAINFGTGLYSLVQPRLVYFYEDEEGNFPNNQLQFTKSWQTVGGYSWKFGNSFRLKPEVYYQYLYNVPVIIDIPQESILNFDENFNLFERFVNKGTGKNYGVEVTLEKFLTNNYYFMVTGALYQSRYKGYDEVERNTRFNGNYSLNVLGGYEWVILKNYLLSANFKGGSFGGKRSLQQRMVTDEAGKRVENIYSEAYKNKYPNYFRMDVNLNMKMNFKKKAVEFFVELANLTNHKNIWLQYYNIEREEEMYVYHYGFTVIGGVKGYF